MSPEECRWLEALAHQHNTFDSMDYDNDNTDFKNVLDGTHSIDISHAGDEFQDLAREIYKDFDHIQQHVNAFDQQLFALTDAYLKWSYGCAQHRFKDFMEVHRNAQSQSDPNSGVWDVQVVDIFCKFHFRTTSIG
ncbi:uncharacterized protein F5147DRAFT_587027 [Suillus discolor]|uniref:Uncharacterized protein n=1 Tax=Suillus discolor TaxID=1912936 RepID=A0A9P7JMH6_9AGAM|nr:uncharacterized protein F5147DRAFT_587027 [Suillus discolor]KAG2089748.1 hypothetical protein F5147DRAFT_587027 [Suillus discolor]